MITCKNCHEQFSEGGAIGTKNRNHCPKCLWSLHLDSLAPGDRMSLCKSLMEPIGLTEKDEGCDKYGRERTGELMIIHRCQKCAKISINRIAGDDNPDSIIYLASKQDFARAKFPDSRIKILGANDLNKIEIQLYGKPQFRD